MVSMIRTISRGVCAHLVVVFEEPIEEVECLIADVFLILRVDEAVP